MVFVLILPTVVVNVVQMQYKEILLSVYLFF